MERAPQTQAAERATDAVNILNTLLGALIDQPRILTECATFADLSSFADQIEYRARTARVLADELEMAAIAMRGEPKIRRVA
jgi:hypothetical protein